MIMKKIVLLLSSLFLLSGCGLLKVPPQPMAFQHNAYLGNYWGKWEEFPWHSFQGYPNNFVVYTDGFHPSNFLFRVTLNSFSGMQIGEEAQFKGTIEYWENEYTTKERFVERPTVIPISESILRKRAATIRVWRKENGFIYNIFFDGVGLGLAIPW